MRLFRFVSLNVAVALALLVGFLIAPTGLKAQDAAAMTGVVMDASGAVVPGTVVTLSNKSTGVSYTQTTDKLGSYRFANVPPGNGYTTVFSHVGFASVKVDNVALNVGITRTQDAKLVAGTNQEVDVSAANQEVTLNTTDASVGNNLDVKVLNDLPVQDRTAGITTLFFLQPGVDSATGAVTGARQDQSEVTVDGMDVNDIAAGTTFAIVGNAPVDSVEQFRGVVAGMVPSVGTGSGGQFQLVTKSGTNQFHGNINEYNRNTDTEANLYFNNLNGVPRGKLIRNQFGGNIGGPIVKDKLFFFFDIAESRINQSAPQVRIVPLTQYRAGELNYVTDGSGCPDNSTLLNNPTCIETLSSAQVMALDPAGIGFDQSLLSQFNARYPLPNDLTLGDGVNTGGYRFNDSEPDNSTDYVARVDYNLTHTQRIFARATVARENAIQVAKQFPVDPITQSFVDRSYSYVVSHIWTIGQNKVNQFYYGDVISKYDFPYLYDPTSPNQYSFDDSITGGGVTAPYVSSSNQDRRVPIPEFRDDFNWQVGHHSLTFGGTFKFIKTNSELTGNYNYIGVGLQGSELESGLSGTGMEPANIGTGGLATSNYDALFASALGVIGDISSNFDYNTKEQPLKQGSGTNRSYRYFETEAYVGDTWKVTPQLTVSYGLRYQLNSVPYETHGEEAVEPYTFNQYFAHRLAQSAAGIAGPASIGTGAEQVPLISYSLGGKANKGPAQYAPSYKDFAPRFALAYNPSWSPKTVFNAGAGIVYDRTVINAIDFIQDQSSNLFQQSVTNQFGSQNGVAASVATDPRIDGPLVGSYPAPSAFPSAALPVAPVITLPYTPYIDSNGAPSGLANSNFNDIIDPTLKDPYSITLNAGVQQELPDHFILKINYAGRFGRRLIAQADASQLIDFPDNTGGSNQTLGAAYANIVQQTRAGANYTNIVPQPWFEDVIPAGTYASVAPEFGIPGVTSNTGLVTAILGALVGRGDFADSVEELEYFDYNYGFPLMPINVGMAAQFSGNTFITNKGASSYNGLLVTVDKNLSQGLQFNLNYTWSHSIDNTSLVANSIASSGYGYICDVVRPRECRANSDFDVTQEINSNFVYELPVGRGRQFMATSSRWLDELIGGWSVSGIPAYRTGQVVNIFSDAFVAGYANDAPAIFTGNRSDVKAHVNIDRSANIVYQFPGGAAGAAKALADFTGPIGFQIGQRNYLRGPGAFTMAAGLAKSFSLIPSKGVVLNFRADAFNVFNHTNFNAASGTNIVSSQHFGQITGTPSGTSAGAPRVAQFSARIEF
jgi:hypothetical protein